MQHKFNFKKYIFLGLLPLVYSCAHSQSELPVNTTSKTADDKVLIRKVVVTYNDAEVMHFVNNSALHAEGWDTLAQPVFWKKIIHLSPDSSIVNIANTRSQVEVVSAKNWSLQSEAEKDLAKAWICQMNKLDSGTCLFVSIGRKDFFEHRKSLATINEAVKIFEDNNVDPWYAQTILLVESPGKTAQKSWAGAIGPFQLMPGVAKMYGLKVTKTNDERQSVSRSAYGASQLLGRSFIPKVKQMLESRNIAYNENATWFRLLVLHTYHAGPGNVNAVLNVINPTAGNMELIKKMWVTTAKGFKNESQNYSQIALGCLLNFNDIIGTGDTINLVYGDVEYRKIKKFNPQGDSAITAYTRCMLEYENDLMDGVIPYDYFLNRVNTLKNDMAAAKLEETGDKNPIAISYPIDENHYIRMSSMLLRKHKQEDAVALLKYNVQLFPDSEAAADSLIRTSRYATPKAPVYKKSKSGGSYSKYKTKK